MFGIVGALKDSPPGGIDLEQRFFSAPEDPYRYTLKWDGEWQITYETFRDMGLAYSVGLILIYLLVVAQFRSYAVPLVIMAPIPLTIIGVMPGHALLGAQFTATSMIGMIALAGIIVRNSILLVDFVNVEIAQGRSLADAVIRAASVRARPDRADGGGGDDRRVLHPRRPDLQRARGLADLRDPGLHGAHARADPDPVLQLSQPKAARLRRKGRVMAKVVVMGAGLGGVACAYEMKKKLGKAHEVTMVGSSAFFEFTPSNPWILVGWRTAPQTRVDLARAARGQGHPLACRRWSTRSTRRARRSRSPTAARSPTTTS